MWGLCEGFLLLVGCHSLFVSEGSSSVHTEQGAEISKPQSLICAPVVNTNYFRPTKEDTAVLNQVGLHRELRRRSVFTGTNVIAAVHREG